ncbi:MAG: GPI anchored serine-threonine rich family protein [Acidobacteria bacterium]|nr:GPI anchored serine-threonine rich family protein [Acidobacteriota bacterium]
MILGLAAAAACAQSAKLTAPKAGEAWAQDAPQAITWTWNGAASIKLMLFSQSGGSIGAITSGLALNAGSFTWTVGTLENGKKVPAGSDYKVRILTVPDNTLLAIGPAFSIIAAAQPGQPTPPAVNMVYMPITHIAVIPPQAPAAPTPIVFSLPGNNDVWIPLKPYTMKWSWTYPFVSQNESNSWIKNCPGFPMDAWIIPTASPAQKIPLFKEFCCKKSGLNWVVTVSGTYEGIVPNLAAGSYFVRVARSDQPGFYGDSPAFSVKSTLAADTAFLGPDAGQGQVDIGLTDIFFDAQGNLLLKIKNLGDAFLDQYNNVCQVSYQITPSGNYTIPGIQLKGDSMFRLIAKANGEQSEVFLKWGGYAFSDELLDDAKFIPAKTRPFTVFVKVTFPNDSNPGNNWLTKKLCMIQAADIGTRGEIQFSFSPKDKLYIARGTSNQIHQGKLKWLPGDTCEAELEVDIWNYGSVARTFDCWLYVDNLPGQFLSKLSLLPGEKTTWKQMVKIKLQPRCGAHRIVFIADPAEANNPPYPDSHLNNNIPVTLKIICGGTVTGSGS